MRHLMLSVIEGGWCTLRVGKQDSRYIITAEILVRLDTHSNRYARVEFITHVPHATSIDGVYMKSGLSRKPQGVKPIKPPRSETRQELVACAMVYSRLRLRPNSPIFEIVAHEIEPGREW